VTKLHLSVALTCDFFFSAAANARSAFGRNWVSDLDTQSGLPTDIYLDIARPLEIVTNRRGRRLVFRGKLSREIAMGLLT